MQISKAAAGLMVAAGVTAGAGGAFLTTRPAAPETAAIDVVRVDDPGSPIDANAVVPTDGMSSRAEAPAPAPDFGEPARPAPRPRRQAEARPPAAPAALPVAPVAVPTVVGERPLPPAEAIGVVERDAPRPPEPAGPELIELVVAADSVIGLQLDSTISSERARVEDPVDAHVVRDVRVGDRVAIPAGAKVTGQVTLVDRGGRLKERARLGVRFTEIELPNGTRLPIQTETVFREGESQAASSSAKIGGGAIGGAILGGILGGARGAAIGGSVGAGAGATAVMAGGRNQATLTSGSPVTVRIEQPIVITTER